MSYNNYKNCQQCGSKPTYNYKGLTLPVCSECYPEWRKTIPCDWCGQPALDDPIETENDDILYWWHKECLVKAYSNTQREQLKMLAQAL